MKRLIIWCASSVALTAVAAGAFMYGRSEMQSEYEVGREPERFATANRTRPSVEQIRITAGEIASTTAIMALIQTKDYMDDSITGRRQRLEQAWKKSDPQRWQAFDINDRHLVTFYAVKYSEDILEERRFSRVQLR